MLFCISAFALPQLIPNGLSPVCSTRLDTIRPETDVFGHKSGNLKAPEDRMVIKQFMVNGQSLSVHGIFDGHGGEMVAQWLEDHLAERVASVFEQINPQSENEAKQLLLQITLDTDKYLCTQFSKQLADQYRNEGEFDKEYAYIDGSTASFVVQWLDRAYVVQVGDSTTIVYQDNEAVFETKEHKPTDPEETAHIESAGGVVRMGRLNMFGLSRAFGNCEQKRKRSQFDALVFDGQNELYGPQYSGTDGMMRVLPDINVITIDPGHNYLFLSMSDGVFEHRSSEKLTSSMINRLVSRKGIDSEFCEKVAGLARNRFGSRDDISLIAVPNQTQ